MSNGFFGGSKFKQMGLGGGGENSRRQIILAVVLGAIVFSTVGMVLYQTIGKGGGGGKLKGNLPFQCAECNEIFNVKVRDTKRDTMDMNAPMVVDCPECGTENAGIFAPPCKNCKKPFARNSDKYMYEFWKENDQWPMRLSQNENVQLEDDICPHCGENNSPKSLEDDEEYYEEEEY